MALIKIANEQIKEDFPERENAVLAVNLRYPVFEGENASVVRKLNEFYFRAADGFLSFCKKKYVPLIARNTKNGHETAKSGAVMSWYVSFLNEKLLSMITDISFFDGKEKKSSRLVHNWDLCDGTPMRAREAFSRSRSLKKLYTDEIASRIRSGDGNFRYHEKAEKLAADRFDFEKFYFTPKGVAFYYDRDVLFFSDSVYPAYVIPFSEVEGLTSLYRD